MLQDHFLGEFIAVNAYRIKGEISNISNTSFHLTNLRKKNLSLKQLEENN
jgi:hypothetical protein